MARFFEPDADDIRAFAKLLSELPAEVKGVVEKFPPWELYRIKSTGARGYLSGFDKGPPVTFTIAVTGEFNQVPFNQNVFGLTPDDIEPCELPDPSEQLGITMTEEEAARHLDKMRVQARPDLWVMGEDGKAHRRLH